jgi:hypothetical protein
MRETGRTARRAVVVVSVLAALAVASGYAVIGLLEWYREHQEKQVLEAISELLPEDPWPREVGGSAITVGAGVVHSDCFSFDLPPNALVDEGASGCLVPLTLGNDRRTPVTVAASSEHKDRQGWLDAIMEAHGDNLTARDAMLSEFPAIDVSVEGEQAEEAMRFYVAFIPEDRFVADGVPLTAIAVWGAWSEDVRREYEEIIESIEVVAPRPVLS